MREISLLFGCWVQVLSSYFALFAIFHSLCFYLFFFVFVYSPSFSYFVFLFPLLLFSMLLHFIKYSTLPSKRSLSFLKRVYYHYFSTIANQTFLRTRPTKTESFLFERRMSASKVLGMEQLEVRRVNRNVFRVLLIQSANSKIQSSQQSKPQRPIARSMFICTLHNVFKL